MNILNNQWFVQIIGGIMVYFITLFLSRSLFHPSPYSRANSKFLNMIRFRVVTCSIPTINEVANEIHKTSEKYKIRRNQILRISDSCRLVISEIKVDPFFSKLERETHIQYLNDFIISIEEFQMQNEVNTSGLIATYIKLLKKYKKSYIFQVYFSSSCFSIIIVFFYVLTNISIIKLSDWFPNTIIIGEDFISSNIRILAVWLTFEVIFFVCFLFILRLHDRNTENMLINILGENEGVPKK